MRKFNLSLDDLAPHPNTGANFESIYWCDKLIEDFPNIKINLFVPASYARLNEIYYNLSDYSDWVSKLNALPNNYRVNLHGYRHRRWVKDFYMHKKYPPSNNDEWQFLNFQYAYNIGKLMIEEFNRAGVKYEPTFRPPGWKISKEAIKALEALGIKCFAGSAEYYEKHKSHLNTRWVSFNWDLAFSDAPKGNIIAYGHTSNWTNNYMNEDRYNLIKNTLNSDNFDFRFIEEM